MTLRKPEHIIDPIPPGAECAKRGCYRRATKHRFLNELIIARDGSIHEATEPVCDRHSDDD